MSPAIRKLLWNSVVFRISEQTRLSHLLPLIQESPSQFLRVRIGLSNRRRKKELSRITAVRTDMIGNILDLRRPPVGQRSMNNEITALVRIIVQQQRNPQ